MIDENSCDRTYLDPRRAAIEEGWRPVVGQERFDAIFRTPSHNNFVAWALRDEEIITDTMRAILEPELWNELDWSDLQFEDSVFVDKNNHLHLTDVRFSVPYRGSELRQPFVGEHKSSRDLRFFRQMSQYIWLDEREIADESNLSVDGRPILRLPFMFYTGADDWIFGVERPSVREFCYVHPASRLLSYSCDEAFYSFSVVHTPWNELNLAPITRVFYSLAAQVATKRLKPTFEVFEPLRTIEWTPRIERCVSVFNQYWIDALCKIEGRRLRVGEILDIVRLFNDHRMEEKMTSMVEYFSEEEKMEFVRQGEKQGRQQGVRQGALQEIKESIGDFLIGRFACYPCDIKEKIENCSDYALLRRVRGIAYSSDSLESFQIAARDLLGWD